MLASKGYGRKSRKPAQVCQRFHKPLCTPQVFTRISINKRLEQHAITISHAQNYTWSYEYVDIAENVVIYYIQLI